MIREVRQEDAKDICALYNYYIANTVVTFEETPLQPLEMSGRIEALRSEYPFLVFQEDDELVGYAYAGAWRSRSAFRYTAESTVYVKQGFQGRGIGAGLYDALLSNLKQRGFHAVIGVVSLPNPASIALHERMGFNKAGRFSEVGFKFGRWIDVGFWELKFSKPPI